MMTHRKLNLRFKPLEINDLKLIYDWFKLPEVNKWYAQEKEWSMADIEAKYKQRLTGKEVIPSFIITLDSKNIGFIQYYPFSKTALPEGLSHDTVIQRKIDIHNSAGLDLFIGDELLIGQGLGKYIIRDFIKQVIPKNYTTIFVDPHRENSRAVRAYGKTGFKE